MSYSVLLPALIWGMALYRLRPSALAWWGVVVTVPFTLLFAGYVETSAGLEYRMPGLYALVGVPLVVLGRLNPLAAAGLSFLSLLIPDVIAGVWWAYQHQLGFAWLDALGGGGWVDALVVVPAIHLAGFTVMALVPKAMGIRC